MPSARRSMPCSARRPSSWVGGERGADGHIARGGHAARSQRHLLLPVLHEVQSRIGWISPPALGYVCRRLTIPPAEAYGVASFYALFGLEPRPPVVAHVCTDIACMCRGSAELVRASSSGRSGRPGSIPTWATRSGWRAPAWACASGRRRRWSPAPARTPPSTRSPIATAADVVAALTGEVPRPMPPGPVRPVGGELRLLRRIGHRRPGEPRQLPQRRRLRRPAPRDRAGTGRRDPRGDRLEAARPRRRRLPHRPQVGRRRPQPGAPALPGLQRRRVGAGHVQGPDRDRERPVRADRGADDRRLRDRRRARATSTCAASTRWPGSGCATRSSRRTRATCWATT